VILKENKETTTINCKLLLTALIKTSFTDPKLFIILIEEPKSRRLYSGNNDQIISRRFSGSIP
jgi:hypothetical protein